MDRNFMTASAQPSIIQDLLEISVSYGTPADRLAFLQGMGLPLDQLIQASIALHVDTGEALLAVPAPLQEVLKEVPSAVAEKALLGFTIQGFHQLPEIRRSVVHTSGPWKKLPVSLLDLFLEDHPLVYQLLYVGTVLVHPGNTLHWARCLAVMRRLPCPRALPPHMAPVTSEISKLYDTAPNDPDHHPFFFFMKNRLV